MLRSMCKESSSSEQLAPQKLAGLEEDLRGAAMQDQRAESQVDTGVGDGS